MLFYCSWNNKLCYAHFIDIQASVGSSALQTSVTPSNSGVSTTFGFKDVSFPAARDTRSTSSPKPTLIKVGW